MPLLKKYESHFGLLCNISKLSDVLTGSRNIENFLQRSTDAVADHLKAEVCSIYLYDEAADELILRATKGLNRNAVGVVRMKPGEGLTGTAFQKLKTIREPVATRNPHFKHFTEADEDPFQSFLAVPILRGEQKIGVMTVQHKDVGYFDETDALALRAAATQLAGAIENARLLMGLQITEKQESPAPAAPPVSFFKGETASPGFALAPLMFFNKSHGDFLHRFPASENRFSREDFLKAVEITGEQLRELQARLSEKMLESASLIFSAHFMMLKDPKYLGQMTERIDSGMSPPDAVVSVTRKYIDIFSASPNAYIREKAGDMEDLGGRILMNLMNPEAENLFRAWKKIVIARELYPSEILMLASEEVAGIILVKGGVASHVAILARSLGIPLIIAECEGLFRLEPGTLILMDAETGSLMIDPDENVIYHYEERNAAREKAEKTAPDLELPPVTRDGCRIRLLANINLLSELTAAEDLKAEGVGLYRTEFPFIVRPNLPSEEEQYLIYKRLFEAMGDRIVTIRTLDIGGEKALSYLELDDGGNPELGLRSIRFSLSHRHIFAQQVRAVLRAAAGNFRLRLMFPLISSVDEFLEAKQVVEDCMAELKRGKIGLCETPEIGMMLETPSVLGIMDGLAEVSDFFSIGTNDFIQYTLAVDRTNEKVAAYYRPYHPSILRGLAAMVRSAVRFGKDISVCGEMGRLPQYIPFLIGIGIRTLSVDPRFLPEVRKTVSGLSLAECESQAQKLLAEDTIKGVAGLLKIGKDGGPLQKIS